MGNEVHFTPYAQSLSHLCVTLFSEFIRLINSTLKKINRISIFAALMVQNFTQLGVVKLRSLLQTI